ncbi:MAG: DVU3141 family protein [Parvibaculum sp.]
MGLSGCVTTDPSANGAGASAATAMPTATDTIAQYAVSAALGSTTTIQSPGRGSVLVKVGGDYVSAAGNRCKRVTLSDTTGWLQINAVCLNDTAWMTVVSL